MLCFTQIGKQEMQIALHNLYHKYLFIVHSSCCSKQMFGSHGKKII